MIRVVKYIVAGIAALFGLAAALFAYSYFADQERFAEARNECERGCIQDSGGFPDCRTYCENHPEHYP